MRQPPGPEVDAGHDREVAEHADAQGPGETSPGLMSVETGYAIGGGGDGADQIMPALRGTDGTQGLRLSAIGGGGQRHQ